MDAFYKWLDGISGLPLLDTGLLVLIFVLIRGRIQDLIADLKCARERITRLERAIHRAGIELGQIEEE